MTVWDPRVVSHPDPAMLADAGRHAVVVTVEDGVRHGGAGMYLGDALRDSLPLGACPPVVNRGVPRAFLAQGKPDRILARLDWTRTGWCRTVRESLAELQHPAELRCPAATRPGPATSPATRRHLTGARLSSPGTETCSTISPMTPSTSQTCSRPPSTPTGTGSTWWPPTSAAPTPRWRRGPTAWPTSWPPTASDRATTSGIYALNSVEWVETAWAVFKLRAVWININYRYVEGGAPLPLHQRRPRGTGPPGRVLAPRDRRCSPNSPT